MKKPKMITREQTEAIAARLSKRDRLLFRLCCETGLRISDALAIKAAYASKIMYIKEQKTGKHKIIELSDELLKELEPYKRAAERPYVDRERKLFTCHRTTYHRHLKNVAKALEIDFSSHSTRKFYAMQKFLETGDIFEVQKSLNHRYVTETCNYLDINFNEMIKSATDREQLQKK